MEGQLPLPQPRPLGLGIVGCGFVTRSLHLPALAGLTDIQVVAVADVDEIALREVADEFAIAARYRTALELVQNPAVEAVAVCVPPAAHAEVACLALDAGKHIFVEKPLSVSLDDAAALVERAARAQGSATTGFNLRWHRLVRRAHDEVRAGRLGDVQCLRSVFSDSVLDRPGLAGWRTKRELGGGALLDRAVHHFDLWRWLLDDEVSEVLAVSRSERADDDALGVLGRMRKGAITNLTALDASATEHSLEIYGNRGALRLDLYRADGLDVIGLDVLHGAPSRRLRRAARSVGQMLRGGRMGDFASSYRAQWSDFAAVCHGAAPSCGLEDGRRALEIALAVGRSAAEGRPVELAGEGTRR